MPRFRVWSTEEGGLSHLRCLEAPDADQAKDAYLKEQMPDVWWVSWKSWQEGGGATEEYREAFDGVQAEVEGLTPEEIRASFEVVRGGKA